jgi:hypothetical protein
MAPAMRKYLSGRIGASTPARINVPTVPAIPPIPAASERAVTGQPSTGKLRLRDNSFSAACMTWSDPLGHQFGGGRAELVDPRGLGDLVVAHQVRLSARDAGRGYFRQLPPSTGSVTPVM